MLSATSIYIYTNEFLYIYTQHVHNKHRVFAHGRERNILREGYVCIVRIVWSGCDDDIETYPLYSTFHSMHRIDMAMHMQINLNFIVYHHFHL